MCFPLSVCQLTQLTSINRYYDTVFLIDDSGSVRSPVFFSPFSSILKTIFYFLQMGEGNPTKWQECVQAVIGIANTAIDNDQDGIDIYFLNSDNVFKMKDEVHGVTVRFSCVHGIKTFILQFF